MSDSQRFPVAAHTLAYLAHMDATAPARAVASAELAASVPTNPVVVRRVTALLAKAGLIGTRTGASGGAWLIVPPEQITLDRVLKAVNGCAHLGVAPPGVKGCPVGARIPDAIRAALTAADEAASERLARISVADLLALPPLHGEGQSARGDDRVGMSEASTHAQPHRRASADSPTLSAGRSSLPMKGRED